MAMRVYMPGLMSRTGSFGLSPGKVFCMSAQGSLGETVPSSPMFAKA